MLTTRALPYVLNMTQAHMFLAEEVEVGLEVTSAADVVADSVGISEAAEGAVVVSEMISGAEEAVEVSEVAEAASTVMMASVTVASEVEEEVTTVVIVVMADLRETRTLVTALQHVTKKFESLPFV